MPNYTRLSVPVSREDATAARRVREWFTTPGGADLCAGVPSIDVGTLDRIADAVKMLDTRLSMLRRTAECPRDAVRQSAPVPLDLMRDI